MALAATAPRYSRLMRRIERLINLIAALLESDRPMTAEEIHDRIAGYGDEPTLDAFRRAFERDKDALRGLGIPLELVPTDPFSDQADGYIISKAKYYLPELDLEHDELAALRIAAEAILGGGEDVTSGAMKVTMDADVEVASPRVIWGTDVAAQQPWLGPLYSALLDRTAVRFGYTTSSGENSTRAVEAYGLVHRRGHWYVVGRDQDRDDVRSFKLSRISSPPERTNETYEVPASFDAAGHMREAWEIGDDKRAVATIRFDPSIKWWADQNMPDNPRSQAPGGALDVEVEVSNPDALISWILGFGAKAKIVAPDSARERMLQHLAPYMGTR